MIRITVFAGAMSGLPFAALAYCDPPYAPAMTSETLAREFREDFKAEFETYFADAQAYISCIDVERQQIMLELRETATRYERFLNDSRAWED